MIRVLGENPERWSKIYALSRRPPSGTWPKTVEHLPLDFLSSPGEIAKVLQERNIKPDYVFFFSYVLVVDDNGALQWGDQRLVDKNSELTTTNLEWNAIDRSADLVLTNFLEALPLASALPKRIFIQFGGKWYGVHLGQTDNPDEETDSRLDLEPNLYYTQHDILGAFCAKHKIGWNSAYPSFIIGAALDSSQSLFFPLLVYASVQKYLGKPLEYPADLNAWYEPQSLSNAVLNSYLYEWSVLAPNTANQDFNASDDCAFTWGKAWPRLASYFDMEYIGPDTSKETQFREKAMKYEPPPHGRGPASKMRFKFSFVEWARKQENVDAWKELAKKHDLRDSEWKDVGSIFGRADFCLHRPFSNLLR